jgi:hypothetical protein
LSHPVQLVHRKASCGLLATISSGEPYSSRKGHTVPHWVQEEQESMNSVTVFDIGGTSIRLW